MEVVGRVSDKVGCSLDGDIGKKRFDIQGCKDA